MAQHVSTLPTSGSASPRCWRRRSNKCGSWASMARRQCIRGSWARSTGPCGPTRTACGSPDESPAPCEAQTAGSPCWTGTWSARRSRGWPTRPSPLVMPGPSGSAGSATTAGRCTVSVAEGVERPSPDTAGPMSVAVIGTGAIGQDLVSKIHRSPLLECALVAGRRRESAGLAHAAGLGYPTTAGGIEAILDAPRAFGVVFDATTARSHAVHWRRLQPLDTLLIDLTPSRIGHMVVPTVTGNHPPTERNVSLISCGGQASIPIAHALASRFRTEYIEVVSTVASSIAGRGTRLNLDEYVVTTQYAVARFSGVHHVKAILNVSPAVPPATFRTTVHAIVPGAAAEAVRSVIA